MIKGSPTSSPDTSPRASKADRRSIVQKSIGKPWLTLSVAFIWMMHRGKEAKSHYHKFWHNREKCNAGCAIVSRTLVSSIHMHFHMVENAW